MEPYDAESLTLGATLRFGSKASSLAIPVLTSDKFIFDSEGNLGGKEHAEIWQAVINLTLQGKEPTLVNLIDKLPAYARQMRVMTDRIQYAYYIHEFDGNQYLEWVYQVDRQGRVYKRGVVAQQQAGIVKDLKTFTHTLAGVKDIDQWENERQAAFQTDAAGAVTGYTHVSTIVDELQARWKDILDGKQALLVDSGMPSLVRNKLFPRGKLSVLHGLSGSGKSSFAFEVLLGTALGLVANNQPGCVAVNSLEMDQHDLVQRLASILSGVDVSKLVNNTLTSEEASRLIYWSGVVATLPIFVDATNFITTTAMQYRASGLNVSPHGPVVQLVTDYGELFGDEEDTKEQRVDQVFRRQFFLARLLNASVLAISQSTNDKNVSGKTYIAGPDGTRYSKGTLQSADVLVELWNPPQIEASGRDIVAPPGLTLAHPYLFIQKNRGASVGQAVPFGWKAASTTFFDLDFDQISGDEILFTHLEKLGYKYVPEAELGAW